jgi:predicted ATP-dependent serine protease
MATKHGYVGSAEPLLASLSVGDEELEELFERVIVAGRSSVSRDGSSRLSTGVDTVDDALGGGLEKGRLVGVSCEVGGESVDVSPHA